MINGNVKILTTERMIAKCTNTLNKILINCLEYAR